MSNSQVFIATNTITINREEITPSLLHAAVAAIDAGDALAVVVKNFYPSSCCQLAAALIEASSNMEGYAVEPSFLKSGETIFDTQGDSALVARYLALAPSQRAALQNKMLPLVAPDKLLQMFWQDLWPHSACLEEFNNGQFANFGVARQIRRGGAVEPHCDRTDADLPGNAAAISHRMRCPGNVYLRVPGNDGGGVLQLWDMRPDAESYKSLRDSNSPYALDRKKLGPPAVCIQPEIGTYVFFSGAVPHAVTPVSSGDRIAVSGFVAFTSFDATARLYS
ncbi:hypothetical protein UNDYM_5977 (plasmid) [Undibacterium sp. YM2]|uniref:2OG-Fe(II) oxygenase n=1 Tax=Undibacterium sp. YM2 TaxID=2058625 RepID=UPI001331E67B|nr:2OG-Fe(II) oxygenase [Undibacterium sp. YM2]BBB70230.1 hypothetical protein UNDYM_5977 [Undibacterium sp. YM2]